MLLKYFVVALYISNSSRVSSVKLFLYRIMYRNEYVGFHITEFLTEKVYNLFVFDKTILEGNQR